MVGHEIWQKTLKNEKDDKNTLQVLEYGEKPWKTCKMRHKLLELDCGEKTEKMCKMRHKQYMTWNMARNNEKGAK